jgi:PiT family inorganic phosphate transporter
MVWATPLIWVAPMKFNRPAMTIADRGARAALAHQGLIAILWSGVFYKVILPMVLSPLIGYALGLGIMKCLNLYLGRNHNAQDKAIFRHLQIGSACLVALSHGMNDAQKSMGLITLGLFAAGYIATPEIPLWVILACAIVMGLGTASGGFRIIRTMGFSITRIDPIQGFAAETSASSVILAASFLGMPISSTQMIAGSITGVGSSKGVGAVKWNVAKKLVLTWVFTLPGAGILGTLAYLIARAFGFS